MYQNGSTKTNKKTRKSRIKTLKYKNKRIESVRRKNATSTEVRTTRAEERGGGEARRRKGKDAWRWLAMLLAQFRTIERCWNYIFFLRFLLSTQLLLLELLACSDGSLLALQTLPLPWWGRGLTPGPRGWPYPWLLISHHLVQGKVVTRTTAGLTFLGEGLAMVLGPDLLNSLVNAVSHNSNERYRFLN